VNIIILLVKRLEIANFRNLTLSFAFGDYYAIPQVSKIIMTTMVVHSRDEGGSEGVMGVNHEVNAPKITHNDDGLDNGAALVR